MTIVRDALLCAVLLAAAVLLGTCARVVGEIPAQIEAARGDLALEVATTRVAAIAEIDAQANGLRAELHGAIARSDRQVTGLRAELHGAIARSDRQVTGLRSDLFGAWATFETAGNARIGDTLGRVDAALGEVREIRGELAPLVLASTSTVASVGGLADAYGALPERVAASPAWLAIEPEITCKHADGTGYGGCWHARTTALMGEAANVGGVFTKKFPAFSDSVTGIAGDVHLFTSKAVAPRGFWGTFKDFVGTGSGVTRALGAAGLFDAQVAAPGK